MYYTHQGTQGGMLDYVHHPMYTQGGMLGYVHRLMYTREACWAMYTSLYTPGYIPPRYTPPSYTTLGTPSYPTLLYWRPLQRCMSPSEGALGSKRRNSLGRGSLSLPGILKV